MVIGRWNVHLPCCPDPPPAAPHWFAPEAVVLISEADENLQQIFYGAIKENYERIENSREDDEGAEGDSDELE